MILHFKYNHYVINKQFRTGSKEHEDFGINKCEHFYGV